MLGIRHYNKTAIDLWQGESRSFVCDHFFAVKPEWSTRELAVELASIPSNSHVVLTFGPCKADEAQKMMGSLKECLDQQTDARLRRITFVLSSMPQYELFQIALFDTFPEGESGA